MGLFILDKGLFEVIRGVEALSLSLSHCLKRWIDSAPLKACDSTGRFWLDIDTLDDLEYAETMMEGWT
jgi:NDP-sugar pyrophosphorylase family protein